MVLELILIALGPITVRSREEPWNLRIGIGPQIGLGDSKQRRLHGTGRDLGELQEKGGERQDDRGGHKELLDVVANARAGIRLEPAIGHGDKFRGSLLDVLPGTTGANDRLQFRARSVNVADGFGRKEIALFVQEPTDVLTQLDRPAYGSR